MRGGEVLAPRREAFIHLGQLHDGMPPIREVGDGGLDVVLHGIPRCPVWAAPSGIATPTPTTAPPRKLRDTTGANALLLLASGESIWPFRRQPLADTA